MCTAWFDYEISSSRVQGCDFFQLHVSSDMFVLYCGSPPLKTIFQFLFQKVPPDTLWTSPRRQRLSRDVSSRPTLSPEKFRICRLPPEALPSMTSDLRQNLLPATNPSFSSRTHPTKANLGLDLNPEKFEYRGEILQESKQRCPPYL